MSASIDSTHVRESLVRALELDLVGPDNDHELAAEILPQAPSRWYLTGFLVPGEADEEQKLDETVTEEVDAQEDSGGADDAGAPDTPAARVAYFPSSLGLSVLVAPGTETLEVTARWGDYRPEALRSGEQAPPEGDDERLNRGRLRQWVRTPRRSSVAVAVAEETAGVVEHELPGSDGLRVAVSVRNVTLPGTRAIGFPQGARSVSVFLVNRRTPAPDDRRDVAFVFQASLELSSEPPLVRRPDLRGLSSDGWDERVADLQYRDAAEFAVGHGIATRAETDEHGRCHRVATCWMPRAEVERVAPAALTGVGFAMEDLSKLRDAADATTRLGGLVTRFRAWISDQEALVPGSPRRRKETGEELLRRAGIAADRMERGIALLADPDVLDAFRIANRVMATAARQRLGAMQGHDPSAVEAPRWRPFQLAFLLMNLAGIVEPTSHDRGVVDLLFFPTGGGKTEAYLGLAAFTLVLRRLRNPGITSAGLSVLMRYTLRLLTLDQLSRAATLICALELERQQDEGRLGAWPFEIGLWVGLAATPNRMGSVGDRDRRSARAKTISFLNDDRKPSPIPLEECPWCGAKFKRSSFELVPDSKNPTDLRVNCVNRRCAFSRGRPLPILGVDEPIYRRLPCFLVATVDKLAAMPWTGEVGAFFGRVDRYDRNGFYGPCAPGRGGRLPGPLLPPDLVIQDELHLISGPMGTMVGLYETALDELCAREVGGVVVRPKIVASTATVRLAERQIRALFNRPEIDIFPPPGPNRRDSFFARTHATGESNARLYLGIAAQGRSLKVVLLRAYLALMGAAQKAYREAGGFKNESNPADPYMTVLGYFNSLRELGGSRRIIEDEVSTRLTAYSKRTRVGERDGSFADRRIAYEVLELTSRVSTDKVADAKRRLACPFCDSDRVDVAIATNMISVGLDIVRLGLMVVLGQPKTSAEYIQATSRVGRDPARPGLVVTLLNVHRPRDRSHLERFVAYHETFYRNVEATSVTPFSPRALDRGLAGTVVGLARLGHGPMTAPRGAAEILNERAQLQLVPDVIAARAEAHDASLASAEATALGQHVHDRVVDLMEKWAHLAMDYHGKGVTLQYQREVGGAQRLLYEFLHPDLRKMPRHRDFRANRSMRDVEPSVNLWMRTLDGVEVEAEEVES